MKTYGIPSENRLVSLELLADGSVDLRPLCPRGQFVVRDPAAPWNRPDSDDLTVPRVERDPAAYPGLLFTTPAVVPLVKEPEPAINALTQRAVPRLDWEADRVVRRWDVVAADPLTAAEIEHLADTTLDGWARAWGYTSAARAVTYVGDPNPRFNAEAIAIRNARSALWTGLSAAADAQGDSPAPTRGVVVAFIAQFAPVRPQIS